MSRGLGRCQRDIIEALDGVPERRMSRSDLDDVLVAEGYLPQNTLRALKSLARRRRVFLSDASSKKETIVHLPREVRVYSEDEIAAIIRAIGG